MNISKYIPIKNNGNFYSRNRQKTVSFIPKESYIKGVISDVNIKYAPLENALKENKKQGFSSDISIKYGIEQYFIPENSGKNIRIDGIDDFAIVKLDKQGNAVITGLTINGVRF